MTERHSEMASPRIDIGSDVGSNASQPAQA
jgi:hypothetical protein